MQPTRPIDILLIDDHQLFNEGLKLLLDEQPEFRVCGQVFQYTEALAAIGNLHPDLIMLDVNLRGANGIDIGKRILIDFPGVLVIMLTMYDQPKLVEETRRAGLHGYLLKDATTPALLHGIRSVLNGVNVFDIPTPPAASPADDPFGDDFARRLNLTFREVEIIRLLRKGLSNSRIAQQLNISVFTVKTHRKNIHFKLGISNVAELIEFATRHRL